ncbi:hypothetical protein LPY66_15355 [Dehalobacter sp. DCM]|uniref:hypothetical protein n=1 Tax=Dehalobacter sp. DCM TaxID=2907827 RepID=UPI0030814684|nr:hypothetical protein LPY66_15285 [Dehalobacter sp. DCM]UWG96267.1 hypothetical protein LPY66_15355 [Dehalobacter sp. DCM]
MRDDLIRKINTQKLIPEPSHSLPVVSLEDFFEGNTDESSIGCNLLDHPGIEKFYSVLMTLRDKDCVQDILVEIYEVEEDYWPFSERVYILSNLSIEEVSNFISDLQPSDIGEGYQFGEPKVAPLLKEGFSVFSVWWD